ncbi:unnamed protein product [Caenorhabditis angaria]|uniref:LisH domain-containing protein n=1 Tax=Caenorhabditis angaria TaxID=860376 RepID=A0A9P1J1L1_9PELO|nr:unnamed protein product [Caenorhabditis angaria]
MGVDNIDTIKFIIWKFMVEQGLEHSAFSFFHEANVSHSKILDGDDNCPRDALIMLLNHSSELLNYSDEEDEEPEENHLIKKARYLHGLESLTRTRDVGKARHREPFFKPSSQFPSNSILLMNGHSTEGVSCAWHPTEDCILSTSGGFIYGQDSTVRIWNLNTQAERWTSAEQILKDSPVFCKKDTPVSCASWCTKTQDKHIFAMGTDSGEVGLYQRDFRNISSTNVDGSVKLLTWSPETAEGPDYLGCATFEGDIVIFDCTDRLNGLKQPVKKLKKSGFIREMYFLSHDTGKIIVDDDKVLYLYSLKSDEPVRKFFGHRDMILSHTPAPKYNLFSSSALDGTVRIWTPDQSIAKQTHQLSGSALFSRWSPNSETIIAQSDDLVVTHFDIPTGKRLKEILYCPGTDAEFSHNGNMFAVGCDEGMVYVWDSRSYEMVRVQKRDDDHTRLVELHWSHDDKKIAAMYEDGGVRLFDMRV